jgi:hypothetical protein
VLLETDLILSRPRATLVNLHVWLSFCCAWRGNIGSIHAITHHFDTLGTLTRIIARVAATNRIERLILVQVVHVRLVLPVAVLLA